MGKRSATGASATDAVTLDDRPLSVMVTDDDKRIVVVLPFELWVISAQTLEVERTIELTSAHPTCIEAEDHLLWIGGSHLFRGGLFSSTSTKVGTKLGGFVDHVAQLRSRLLCGVGTHGEILWDLAKQEPIHRRKAPEHEVFGLVAAPDGRAVYADGGSHVWVIDPDHASGYMKLKLKDTSPAEVAAEGIVRVGVTRNGNCILAARDGAVGWTNRAVRLENERLPAIEGDPLPLAVAGDERWVYVLRAQSVLQRFLIRQPPNTPGAKEQPEPLPLAQQSRLQRRATAMALAGNGKLVLAGPHADDHLGRLWSTEPGALAWETLRLRRGRTLVAAPEPSTDVKGKGKVPSFERTRTKVSGPQLSTIKVDAVIGATPQTLWVTRPQGTLVERPHMPIAAGDVMPGDTVVLPAMVRFREGTARPALVLWPGVADRARAVQGIEWLAWADNPRGWMPLRTPDIRQQGWSRREVFPLQIALNAPVPDVAGQRAAIPGRWVDVPLHQALGRECKKLLKVLW